jgi:hypothetical protein
MKAGRLFAVMIVVGAVGMLTWAGSATAAAGPIAGTVTNQSAQPLKGIKVCAVVLAPYRETCASTDAAGEYSIPGTGPGYKVHFYDPDGMAPSRAPQWYPGVLHPEEGEAVTEAEIASGIDAEMWQGAEYRGEVDGNDTGDPLTGVEICVTPSPVRVGEVPVCDESDVSGKYVLSDLGPGSYRITYEPGEGMNYQAVHFTTPPLDERSVIGLNERMLRGVEFQGVLTDGATGLPVSEFGGPGRTPTVCALEPFTEVRVKCVPVGAGGEYAIAGLPPEGYVLVFGTDTKEDGVDLYPDGFVRQYYNDKSNFEEGLVMIGVAGTVKTGLDATLVRGEEIWPGEEEEAPSELVGEEVGDAGTNGGGTTGTFTSTPNQAGGAVAVPAPPPPNSFGVARPQANVLPKYTCKKGFHRVAKGGTSRCVKIKKTPRKHRPKKHHAKKAAHR